MNIEMFQDFFDILKKTFILIFYETSNRTLPHYKFPPEND